MPTPVPRPPQAADVVAADIALIAYYISSNYVNVQIAQRRRKQDGAHTSAKPLYVVAAAEDSQQFETLH